jgi:hypothetical protein
MSGDWRLRREEKRGRFTVRLEIDEFSESPAEWGSLDLILTRHRTRRGAFGDEEWSHNDGLACLPRTDPCWCDEDDPEWHERLQEEWELLHRTDYIAVPVWHTPGCYDGGSLSLSGSDDPDAFVLIRCPHEPLQLVATLTSQWGGQTVEEIAQSYIDTWNHWLAGDVYIYTIEDEDGNVASPTTSSLARPGRPLPRSCSSFTRSGQAHVCSFPEALEPHQPTKKGGHNGPD